MASRGRHVFEQQLARTRANEYKTADIASKVRYDAMLAGNYRSDARVENKRIDQQLNALATEARLEKQLEQELYAKERAVKVAAQEEALVLQMRARKEEKVTREKMVQRIRDTSEELKDLEARLKLAYLNKERAAQLEEKKTLGTRDRNLQLALDAAMEDERQRLLELEEAKEKLRKEQALEAKNIIQSQLREREEAKARAFEQFLEEKKAVDQIVSQILEEDAIAVREHLERQKRSREYIQQYLRDKEVWKEAERRRQAEEDARIQRYADEQRARAEISAQKKAERADARADEVARIMERINREEAEKRELEALRDELYWEEEEAKRRQAEREQTEKRIRERIELMEAEKLSHKLKADKKAQLAAEEAYFRQEMLAKFEQDAKLDQMTAAKARLKREQLKRDVEQLLEDRRRQNEMMVQQERAEREREQESENERRRIIEEERKKLLKEHAVKLFGFLPKGVLLSVEDLEVFPAEIREEMRTRLLQRQSEEVHREPFF